MKQLSHWGKAHRWSARLLIVFLYIPLNIAGVLIGCFLYAESIFIPSIWISAAMISTLFAIVFYPQKTATSFFSPYYRRKSLDALLAISTLLFVIICSNRLSSQFHSQKAQFSSVTVIQAAVLLPESLSTSHTGESSTKPIVKTHRGGLIKKFIRRIVRFYLKRTESERIMLLVLTVLGAALAIYLLAGLACSLACGGEEGLAWVVLIGGVALVIWLTAIIFQSIDKKYGRNKRSAPKAEPTPSST